MLCPKEIRKHNYVPKVACALVLSSLVKIFEARVLQFAKRTRTGYYVGTGTRTVRVRYAPMTHRYFFFCF